MTIDVPPQSIRDSVTQALAEDVGTGDITAELIPKSTRAQGRLIAREAGVLCGCQWVDQSFLELDAHVSISWQLHDGDSFAAESTLMRISGNARAILTAERTALNFLQTLSGTATATRALVKTLGTSSCQLLDTRKTLPGLRLAQKYAVRVGGGTNHRFGLYDAFLIKENHIRSCGGIAAAITAARSKNRNKRIEVEVQCLDELETAVAAGADIVMLDNFSAADLVRAVTLNRGRSKLEASGGIESGSLAKIAATGVDYISVGALTKHCRAMDFSLLLD